MGAITIIGQVALIFPYICCSFFSSSILLPSFLFCLLFFSHLLLFSLLRMLQDQ
jgi:hypothetical protein